MTRDKLTQRIDNVRIEEAIREAELLTSGEICVSVSRYFWGDVKAVAEKAFVRMGVSRTKLRNGVLFFVVPSRRKFVVLGDQGIHEKVGPGFWNKVVEGMAELFKNGDYTGGLITGIEHVGKQLSTHFPHNANDENELPDKVDYQ